LFQTKYKMKKLILFILILFYSNIINAQNNPDQKNYTISKSEIESQIYFLASDELRGRKTGSTEIDIAAVYLANILRQYKVKPKGDNNSYYQYVPLEKTSQAKQLSIKLDDLSSEKIIPIQFSNNISLKNDAIYLNFGLEADYKDKDVNGKLIIVKSGIEESNDPNSGFSSISEKQKLAKKHGAIGIIELTKANDDFFNRHLSNANVEKIKLSNSEEDSFIHFWLQDANGSIAEQLSQTKKINLELTVSGIIKEKILSRNIIGMVEGTDPILKNEFVIFAAHYDHLGVGKPNEQNDSIYNGARDNAVGVVAVLNAAKNISKYPTKRSALFILFTAEEVGYMGSKWFVEHPVVPLNKTVYCFNIDNGGYNDTSIVTIVGLERTTANQNITDAVKQSNLRAIETRKEEKGLFYFSDNISFAKKGIPTSTYSLGFTAFDDEIYKYYHNVSDNPDTLDYNYLVRFINGYILSCKLIANNKKPFWIVGDEFYEIGKELYGEN